MPVRTFAAPTVSRGFRLSMIEQSTNSASVSRSGPVEYNPAPSTPNGMCAPENAGRLGLKNAGTPPTNVDQYHHISENPSQAGTNDHGSGRSILFQNSSSLVRRSRGWLP